MIIRESLIETSKLAGGFRKQNIKEVIPINLESIQDAISKARESNAHYTILCSQEIAEQIVIPEGARIGIAVFPKNYNDDGKIFLIRHKENEVKFFEDDSK